MPFGDSFQCLYFFFAIISVCCIITAMYNTKQFVDTWFLTGIVTIEQFLQCDYYVSSFLGELPHHQPQGCDYGAVVW